MNVETDAKSIEQAIKPGAAVSIQIEPSERVLNRIEKAATFGAGLGAGIAVLLIFLVMRQPR